MEPYSRNRDSSLPSFSPFERFSRPHEKKKTKRVTSFGLQSLTTRGTSGNAAQKKKTTMEKRPREMEKKGGEEEDEEVRLAGGPTAVNRDGSNGQTSRVPETPTYFR